jgi:YegS/Rv2252/BmrU family lipid kinase
MSLNATTKLLFIINPFSGNSNINWCDEITNYFQSLSYTFACFTVAKGCTTQTIQQQITSFSPQVVVAVGGDGTIKLVAECIMQTNIALGILPAGSANGLAKELGIPNQPQQALNTLVNGNLREIHVTEINKHLCIHLSDIGFNAYVVKQFEKQQGRGMWGYFVASFKALFNIPLLKVLLQMDGKKQYVKAALIVIANGTTYGSGALINPTGTLSDALFEVIAVKKISLIELFKMMVTHSAYNTSKTEVFQTNNLTITSKYKVHFQVDGEYLGKVNTITARLIPKALQVIVG